MHVFGKTRKKCNLLIDTLYENGLSISYVSQYIDDWVVCQLVLKQHVLI